MKCRHRRGEESLSKRHQFVVLERYDRSTETHLVSPDGDGSINITKVLGKVLTKL